MTNHGANLYDLSKKFGISKTEFLDFSSNINPLGASKLAKKHLVENIDLVSIYPDVEYKNLKNSISSYCNCKTENIILGSGATELISSFIKTLNPKKSLLLTPAYSEYEKELNKINSKITKLAAKKENLFKVDINDVIKYGKKHDLIIICNPNNPTGFTFTKDEIEILLKNTNSMVMIDETYIEFTNKNKYQATELVNDYENLFVIRGTSKFFSTPGIRLGYGLISNDIIKNKINDNLDLWNINIFASVMGEIMFKDEDFIKNSFELINTQRNYFINELSKFKDLEYFDSNGNFILCNIKNGMSASKLREILLPKKIIIRDCSSFEGLDDSFFRFCMLNKKDNELLINSLKEIFI